MDGVNPSDPHALAYLYEQSISDVMQSRCLIPLSAAVDLAGFRVFEETSTSGQLLSTTKLETSLFRYIPSRLLQQIPTTDTLAVAEVRCNTCLALFACSLA